MICAVRVHNIVLVVCIMVVVMVVEMAIISEYAPLSPSLCLCVCRFEAKMLWDQPHTQS
jgi:hypothetical protein